MQHADLDGFLLRECVLGSSDRCDGRGEREDSYERTTFHADASRWLCRADHRNDRANRGRVQGLVVNGFFYRQEKLKTPPRTIAVPAHRYEASPRLSFSTPCASRSSEEAKHQRTYPS